MSKENKADKYKRERDDAHIEISRLTDIIRTFIVDANEMDAQIVEMTDRISILDDLVETYKLLIKNQEKIMTNIRYGLSNVMKSLPINDEEDQPHIPKYKSASEYISEQRCDG